MKIKTVQKTYAEGYGVAPTEAEKTVAPVVFLATAGVAAGAAGAAEIQIFLQR